jgi:hypothetical protein
VEGQYLTGVGMHINLGCPKEESPWWEKLIELALFATKKNEDDGQQMCSGLLEIQ